MVLHQPIGSLGRFMSALIAASILCGELSLSQETAEVSRPAVVDLADYQQHARAILVVVARSSAMKTGRNASRATAPAVKEANSAPICRRSAGNLTDPI
jgi:hypothetical protein